MNKEIIINSSNEETRIAITEDNKFVEEMRNAIEELNQQIETLKGQLLSS